MPKQDHLADAEVNMPSEEEVKIKDDCDADIPQMKVRLGGKVLQEQDKHQKQDDAGEDASSTQLHVCEICSKDEELPMLKSMQGDWSSNDEAENLVSFHIQVACIMSNLCFEISIVLS
ncbi:uncharacterized protein [Hetaerina americana]|uniref:uncharacterized protein isoform X1 n=1 Tax=Hetaerina americana TaxID=62018 RepID=UPI003A7F549E